MGIIFTPRFIHTITKVLKCHEVRVLQVTCSSPVCINLFSWNWSESATRNYTKTQVIIVFRPPHMTRLGVVYKRETGSVVKNVSLPRRYWSCLRVLVRLQAIFLGDLPTSYSDLFFIVYLRPFSWKFMGWRKCLLDFSSGSANNYIGELIPPVFTSFANT